MTSNREGMRALGLTVAGLFLVLPPGMARAVVPPDSSFFSTVHIESADSLSTVSDGDLWPSCWSDDGYLYAANGDGRGFTMVEPRPDPVYDIAVSRVQGMPGSLTGSTLTTQIGQIWQAGPYNRKPTGMVCVDGALYMAVQDLSWDFNDAPNATIAKSTDRGVTWTWNTSTPMFGNYVFTTIMFLDYGKNNAWNTFDSYVYAYGIDHNWRDSFDNSVPDPTKLYLARVPKTSLQNRAAWQFYTGDLNGNASWSTDINLRQPVLQDDRRLYVSTRAPSGQPRDLSVISQGGVVYNKALNRYIYTSWTEYTFEFYEAPAPWGPWKKFLSKDYGGYPWSDTKNGGYSATIPSKFISTDGKTMYVQSNTFMGGLANYNFSLRKLVVEPRVATTPSNVRGDTVNLAIPANGTRAIEKSAHFGNLSSLNNGYLNDNEDSWDQENKTLDWWGYTWPRNYHLNKVNYTTGGMFTDGGWFSGNLWVQVRQNGQWINVSNLRSSPYYPLTSAAGANRTYTFTFNDTWGDGVRIIGTPGGSAYFTSIGELSVYYANPVTSGLLQDPGFENQTSNAVSYPWYVQGTDAKGIDRGLGFSHSGANNGWIRTSSRNWNALKQDVQVTPNTNYVLTAWIRSSANVVGGYFGVCTVPGVIINELNYGYLPDYTAKTVTFNSGSNTSVSVFAGFWAPGSDSFIQVDDFSLTRL
ncbi:hypothetical protein [Archangium lansingense]|uniref:DUF4185 domain-containing protein n=1 Tax=Archangium lansingense TaxID=2995310 RepID=A0ABT4ABQ3_9BACT|nr:hypothetical protein [Archangium lansinium]MCY1079016.1 hypothetical protein [Archangium lansinium]